MSADISKAFFCRFAPRTAPLGPHTPQNKRNFFRRTRRRKKWLDGGPFSHGLWPCQLPQGGSLITSPLGEVPSEARRKGPPAAKRFAASPHSYIPPTHPRRRAEPPLPLRGCPRPWRGNVIGGRRGLSGPFRHATYHGRTHGSAPTGNRECYPIQPTPEIIETRAARSGGPYGVIGADSVYLNRSHVQRSLPPCPPPTRRGLRDGGRARFIGTVATTYLVGAATLGGPHVAHSVFRKPQLRSTGSNTPALRGHPFFRKRGKENKVAALRAAFIKNCAAKRRNPFSPPPRRRGGQGGKRRWGDRAVSEKCTVPAPVRPLSGPSRPPTRRSSRFSASPANPAAAGCGSRGSGGRCPFGPGRTCRPLKRR